jgi:phage shock protein A
VADLAAAAVASAAAAVAAVAGERRAPTADTTTSSTTTSDTTTSRPNRKEHNVTQQTVLGRIGQLVRANVNAMLDQAEDPEKMLDQLVRDYTNNISEAEDAVAQTIGNLRMLEDDNREARNAAQEWGDKAAAASSRADQVRSSGQAAEADRFDNLAKIALQRQLGFEQQVRTFEPQIAQQTELVNQLKDGLNKIRAKREELLQKRDELVSRARMAQAQIQIQQTVKSVSVMDPTSELSRFEERIRRQESLARGREEVAASSLDEQFAQLDEGEDSAEVDARLAQLKAGTSPAPQLSASSSSRGSGRGN